MDKINRDRYLRGQYRKVWFWDDTRKQALKRQYHKTKKKYICEKCDKLVKKAHVDHIIPVGSVNNNWNVFYNRLFCPLSNLQILCIRCHKLKTLSENNLRRISLIKEK